MSIVRSNPVKKFRGVIRRDVVQAGRYVAILLRRDNALSGPKKFMTTQDHAAFEVVQNALASYLTQTV